MICWKIRIFAYWTTPSHNIRYYYKQLWFAEKFVSLLIEQHLYCCVASASAGCDLLKNSYLCLLNNTPFRVITEIRSVVICWKIRIFAYWTTPLFSRKKLLSSCDLLKNSYLCLLNNTGWEASPQWSCVVICWKIRIFAYWTTPHRLVKHIAFALWFAEKFVSLLIEQHHNIKF